MLRRWLSTARPPVTRPITAVHHQPGDIVQVQTFDGELKLGQVVPRRTNFHGSADDKESVEVMFLPTNSVGKVPSSRLVKSGFIRFHHPFGNVDIRTVQALQESAVSLVKEHFAEFQACLDTYIGKAGTAALIYEDEFAERVFGAGFSLDQLYASHLFLYGNAERVVKDSGYKSTPVFHLRSAAEAALLEDLEKVGKAEMESFNRRLYNVLFEGAPKEWTEMDLKFLAALRSLSTTTYLNCSGPVENPFYRHAKHLVSGICQPTPNEVHRILELAAAIPPAYDPIQHASGTLIQERHNAKGNYHLGQAPAWDYPEVVGEEVVAIDSEDTVEVDDALHFKDDWVHVHVADASHFCPHGSGREREARNRVSSIYLPTTSHPMLPSPLASLSSLCPLRTANPSLTFSAKIGSDGSILDYRIRPAVLTKVKRITYEEADVMLEGIGVTSYGMDKGMELANRHYNGRVDSGHLHFNIPKPKIKVSPEGAIDFSIASRDGSLSSKLVSESMTIAGRVAAMFAQERNLPIPFRYHLPPPPHILTDTMLIDRISNGSASRFDSLRLLLSLNSSAVDTRPRQHWAMGLEMYAKATSPLRRYFDLLLHHQLKASLHQADAGRVLSEDQVAAILPSCYRHEQYIKQLQRTSTRYWTLKHAHQTLQTRTDSLLLNTTAIPLEFATGSRQKVWIESLGLVLYANLLGRMPGAAMVGAEIPVRIVSVDPIRNYIDLVIT